MILCAKSTTVFFRNQQIYIIARVHVFTIKITRNKLNRKKITFNSSNNIILIIRIYYNMYCSRIGLVHIERVILLLFILMLPYSSQK